MNVCLIGYNLTNFVTALALIKKSFTVDILYEKIRKRTKTNRTIGISKNNFEFLSSNLKQIYKYSWPTTKNKIFNGTVVFGKIIKFDKGKIGILFGKLKSFFTSINLIFLNYVVIPIL